MPSDERVLISTLMEHSGVAFGTSGARGLVSAMTDRVCFAYVMAFLRYLAQCGAFVPGMDVAIAGDLRPSTPDITRACVAAIEAAGGVAVNCGFIPAPALALHAFARDIPSLMVTGSHIPDDRNGIKFNRPRGELLKSDEAGMAAQSVALPAALFLPDGRLRAPPALPEPIDVRAAYVARYVTFFGPDCLAGRRIGVYQHSAVGRDMLVDICRALGAETVPFGRSDRFVPVDTEAVRAEDVALARQWAAGQALDAILSTDGDSDRPLMADEQGNWLRGDILGILCAHALGLRRLATPVSSNSAVERCGWFDQVIRTRIGSPFVIAAMMEAATSPGGAIGGYEANGGFLLASDVERSGRTLRALPTRDAVLPMLAVLCAARERGLSLSELVETLPARFTHSDRVRDFPTALAQRRIAELRAGGFADQARAVETAFASACGASRVSRIDTMDGLRITYDNGEILHLRPSGNAPELRCYTEAGSMDRADMLNRKALAVVEGWRDA